MSLEQLESAILALAAGERPRLALWFEQHRSELLSDAAAELHTEQEAEIRRRDLAVNPVETAENSMQDNLLVDEIAECKRGRFVQLVEALAHFRDVHRN